MKKKSVPYSAIILIVAVHFFIIREFDWEIYTIQGSQDLTEYYQMSSEWRGCNYIY